MSKFVLDTNIFVKMFIKKEDLAEKARKLFLENLNSGLLDIYVPCLVYYEFYKVIIGSRLKKKDKIIEYFEKLMPLITVVNCQELITKSYELSREVTCSVYDASFVALALREKAYLITYDKRLALYNNNLANKFPGVVKSLDDPNLASLI